MVWCAITDLARGDEGCREHGLAYRVDSSNAGTKRGLVRDEILPLLRRLHPGADRNLLALAEEPARLPRTLERTLVELLSSTAGSRSADLGGGVRAVREYDVLRLEGSVRFGPWRIESDEPGLVVRTRRPGDRLAGRRKKLQDLFVDAKVPRAGRMRGPSSSRATTWWPSGDRGRRLVGNQPSAWKDVDA
jgi:tRNA(Ile)-lysidine synthetase-like protein